ncbi:uncharacterized protein BYT42DRAFT_559506 [Radiomyces spectabilis]|uniref:uncharacterized protein n=1 Tax=Radiomyces spectabilis TaxID=64574 RepID=UPI00221EECB6|nr:uncharacterized protein BYT42DRAFT_559506 [Radiomyces spectabilis]KAI8388263.1 hypothetical protein BYT42DRAFT_559506 [Radiomyces spectabilis]
MRRTLNAGYCFAIFLLCLQLYHIDAVFQASIVSHSSIVEGGDSTLIQWSGCPSTVHELKLYLARGKSTGALSVVNAIDVDISPKVGHAKIHIPTVKEDGTDYYIVLEGDDTPPSRAAIGPVTVKVEDQPFSGESPHPTSTISMAPKPTSYDDDDDDDDDDDYRPPRGTSSGLSGGGIAGIAVGGFVLVSCAVLLYFCVARKLWQTLIVPMFASKSNGRDYNNLQGQGNVQGGGAHTVPETVEVNFMGPPPKYSSLMVPHTPDASSPALTSPSLSTITRMPEHTALTNYHNDGAPTQYGNNMLSPSSSYRSTEPSAPSEADTAQSPSGLPVKGMPSSYPGQNAPMGMTFAVPSSPEASAPPTSSIPGIFPMHSDNAQTVHNSKVEISMPPNGITQQAMMATHKPDEVHYLTTKPHLYDKPHSPID